MTNKLLAATAMAVCLMVGTSDANAQARDQIRIVGSSTVFPFTTAVAEQFGRAGRFKTPVVESTGTGGGMRLFCAGVGPQHPDFTNASRRITGSEFDTCRTNGVTEIVELPVGFDGIVLAVKKGSPKFSFTREQIWKALARQVPVNGQLVNNPYQRWNEIDPALPNWPIEVMGPPPTSGTRDSFVELVMDVGCRNVPEIRAISDNRARQQACSAIREDGKFIEAGENDNLIVQRLTAGQAGLIGIFGYSFLDQNELREHRLGHVSGGAVDVRLRQARPCRGNPRHARVHRRVHERACDGRQRLPGAEGADHPPRRAAPRQPRERHQPRGDDPPVRLWAGRGLPSPPDFVPYFFPAARSTATGLSGRQR